MNTNPDLQLSIKESLPKLVFKESHSRKDQSLMQQVIKEESPFLFYYYVNACLDIFPPSPHSDNVPPPPPIIIRQNRVLPIDDLRKAFANMNLSGQWEVRETPFGVIMAFEKKENAEEIFEKMEIAKVLGGPVQVAMLPSLQLGSGTRVVEKRNMGFPNCGTARFNQISPHCSPRNHVYQNPQNRLLQPPGPLIIRDVPWSIAEDEIRSAFTSLGIQVSGMERWRQHVRIEVKNIYHYEQLISEGFNFYNAGRFMVTGERSGHDHQVFGNGDDILQCYRCQGFWHVAANCRHLPRCVRCGEPHGVEYCTRARGNPLCCNCSGAHHAAYKNCPVRHRIAQAAPIAFVLSHDRPVGSFAEVTAFVGSAEPRCML